jgi:hypothetical protein
MPAPRPPRELGGLALSIATAPAWAARAILVTAIAGATLVIGEPLGLGLTVTLLALGAIAARVKRPAKMPVADLRERVEPAGRDGWTRVWWALAAGLALTPTLRAATWVVVPCILVAAALASLATGGGRRWGELCSGLAGLWARLPLGGWLAAKAAARNAPTSGAALRGGVLAALLLLVFVPLLASADAAFADLLKRAVPDLNMPFERALGAALFASIGGALLFAPIRPIPACPPTKTLTRLEFALPLGALVALFGAFVALQITTLFGGDRHVLNTAGLTYADYARSGFAQLIVVAALTLAVVAATHRYARDDGTLLRTLLTALTVLPLIVLASALKRLGLYEDAFGYTRLRFAAHAILLWLGAIFVLVLLAKPTHLPRAALAITGATVLLFALADPDRRIAQHNLDRYERTGQIDRDYLRGLSADTGLRPCEHAGLGGYNHARSC